MAISRRSLIVSGACLIAAPAIVRVSSIMPVKVLASAEPVCLIPGVNCSIYPNAYGWWQLSRGPNEDKSIEAWDADIRQRFGEAAADTHCGELLEIDRKIRGR